TLIILELYAVTFRVSGHANLVDRADVARGEIERHELLELRHPNAARLDVHVLPALRLDVRVRDVLRLQLALAGNVALGHGGTRNLTDKGPCVKGMAALAVGGGTWDGARCRGGGVQGEVRQERRDSLRNLG